MKDKNVRNIFSALFKVVNKNHRANYSDLELLGVAENHHGEGGSRDEGEGGEGPLLLPPVAELKAVLGDHALGEARVEVERNVAP